MSWEKLPKHTPTSTPRHTSISEGTGQKRQKDDRIEKEVAVTTKAPARK
jgi:hypothetical protein